MKYIFYLPPRLVLFWRGPHRQLCDIVRCGISISFLKRTNVSNDTLWPIIIDGLDTKRNLRKTSLRPAQYCLLDDGIVTIAGSCRIVRILGVQHTGVSVLGVVHVLSDDIRPSVGKEHLANMRDASRNQRSRMDHQVNVVRAGRRVAGEDRLELGNTGGR